MADEWSRVQVADLGRIVTGRTPPGNDPAYYDGVVPFLTPSDMVGHRRVDDTVRSLSAHGIAQLARCLVTHGVGVSCIGWQMGKAVLIDRPTVTNQQINSVIVTEGVADSLFVYYSFCARRSELFNLGAGGSRTPILNKGDFGRLPFMLPPLPEQRAIAHILGTLDDKIELNRRMNETLEAMARALFKSWFVDFDPVHAKAQGSDAGLPKHIADLFPDSFEDSELEEIPRGWSVRSIYDVAEVVYGAPFASAQFNSGQNGEPLVRIRDLPDERPGVWTTELHPKGYKIQPGEIVVGMDGEFRAYLWGGDEAWLNQRVCAFIPKERYSAAFVRNSITGPLAHVEATETATTVIHLGKSDIDRFLVIVPPQTVITEFNQACQPFYDRIVAAKRESRTLASLRDTLLPKLISGELRVKDTEKRIEEIG